MRTFYDPQKENTPSPTLIQPQLEIGKEGDEHEKEANQVADKVMRMAEPGKETMTESKPKLQKMTERPSVMKMAESVAKPKMQESGVKIRQQTMNGPSGIAAPQQVEQGISSSKGKGQSLSAGLQQEMGSKMNADFSDVKIHSDQHAAEMNQEVGAKAFTHGNDIYFNSNQYNPSSTEGKHLLAHELTHTMQQGGAEIQLQKNQTKNQVKSDEKKEHDSSKDGNNDYAVSWYAPFGQRIAQWGYNTNWQYTNVDKKTIKPYLGPFRRNALDNGLFSAVQGLVTELVLKRLGLSEMKSRAAGAGVAIATGAKGLEIKERIRSKTVETYRWYGRYRYHYWNNEILAVDFWEKGPMQTQLVSPVYLDQCIMDADGNILYTYTCGLDLLGVDTNGTSLPTHSYGKVDI